MKRKFLNSITAWIVIVATVLVLFFSEVYISEHVHHDCSGEQCPVCAVIEVCVQNLNAIGTLLLVGATGIILYFKVLKEAFRFSYVFFGHSLISQKVRMNN